MKTLLTNIQQTVDSKNIPLLGSKSRPVFDKLICGVKRKELRLINESFHGAPLEDIEGDKYGHWLIDRYKDLDGDSCLIFNERHLVGSRELDLEARRLRRKERAEFSLKKAKQEERRIPKAIAELNKAQIEYLLSLGDAANEPSIESKTPTEY
ncbi:hypothetical protein WNY51_13970 [Pseudocolwellia sp. AS88]|uniref:hypothetical protein n=1 Tax=Pseudocolwellia sp. AS88 TaxID=3063958 RepID=UPI0026EC4726|nr:hypothetical protein [Pseudocolwellia sp. AS88]MDO7084016.1 hypothetical protein [Pseudocolwellia sp. AS88]